MFKTFTDIRFEKLLARDLIGIVYAVVACLTVLGGLVALVAFVSRGGFGIFVGLILVPIVTILQLLVVRFVAEASVVYFRIAEDVQAIRRSGATPPPPPPAY